MNACWDCEVRIAAGTGPMCPTCERHRADGHKPEAPYGASAGYCHGAGGNGLGMALLDAAPRVVDITRTGRPKNPHVTRAVAA